jgi:hypothetical protein
VTYSEPEGATNAKVMAAAWLIKMKWLAQELADAYASHDDCVHVYVREAAMPGLYVNKFGPALAHMAGPVAAIYPAILSGHAAEAAVLDNLDIGLADTDAVYREARRLGVPLDAIKALFR